MQIPISVPGAFVLSFLGTLILIALLLQMKLGPLWLDRPNDRSLHLRPRHKLGGLAIMIVTLTLFAITSADLPGAVTAGCLGLVIISAIDDAINLPATVRLASHLGAAAVAIMAIPNGNMFVGALGCVTIVWMCNLYNFMDGADGLAGGMTVIGFGALAIAADAGGATGLTIWCGTISTAALAFLLFNFPPARVFMGDAGAVPLGFLAGTLGYIGFVNGVWPFWYPALVFSPFIFDATLTLIRRTLRGKKPWVAHREHLYQRLILSGWSHRRLALVSYAIMAATCGAALAALSLSLLLQRVIIISVLVFLTVLMLAAERHLHSPGRRQTGSIGQICD